MKIPDFIVTDSGDILAISDYHNGKFILENGLSYNIRLDSFMKSEFGVDVPIGVKSKDHQIYLDWLIKNE